MLTTKTDSPTLVCPYTGLRSFTEEESLYFKGRDFQVDQIAALLEQNKFLMVTGASGEGKSSIIYAGLIPNARAGFFKARYSNWVVADFRPERDPVVKMSKALSKEFNRPAETLETELRRGFSSLIDLYTNSEHYIDEEDSRWQQLSESEKKEKRRGAANLLILVDQFEEFFTNPENFQNEIPSQDSQVVVNLVLETARIALKRNLPVYVVCTMRSDYIGQCSAFRGLAEYIGFSQFFVPRLKRKDLKQVIEEPAQLSGNTISQRLIERLVFDISEGVDQLPVLQHALSQVWLAADHGQSEMDLIHYAMVGGMPASELPKEDQAVFSQWLEALPDHQRNLYAETGLNRVIEIHASTLYENAWATYQKKHPESTLTPRDAKRIIAVTFSCLTKIDHSRAVRNRMTLAEITGIINSPDLTAEVVGDVLNSFREEGNSFLRPFKSEDPNTHKLSARTVLDITHESLIRNWKKLNKWAATEFEYYSTFLDFKKQLDRWRKSGKSSDFLIPIGPLTYFENWYATCKPNAYWIRRYIDVHESEDRSMAEAEEILNDTKEFLKRSARKVFVTRAFVKYGARRIAVSIAIIGMLILSGFYWYDATEKQNENVVKRVRKEVQGLLASDAVDDFQKGLYLIIEERLKSGSLLEYISAQKTAKERVSLALNSYEILLVADMKYNSPLKRELINVIVRDFDEYVASVSTIEEPLGRHRRFIHNLLYDNYYNPNDSTAAILKSKAASLYPVIVRYFSDSAQYRVSLTPKVNQAIQLWLTFAEPDRGQIISLLDLLSPADGNKSSVFATYYPQGSFERNGIRPLNFNGGYHLLACLQAAAGRQDEVIETFKLLKEQRDYFSDKLFNNHSNVIGYLYQFGHRDQVPKVIEWLTANSSRTEESIYKELVVRSGYLSPLYRANLGFSAFTAEGSFGLNLCQSSREQFDIIASDYVASVNKLSNQSEKNFLLAMHYKRKGMFDSKYGYDRGITIPSIQLAKNFDLSTEHYRMVDNAYLEGGIVVNYSVMFGIRNREISRRYVYLYPDCLDGWMTYTYHSDAFYKYLSDKGVLGQFYTTGEELNLIHYWITNRFETRPFPFGQAFKHDYPLSNDLLNGILQFAASHKEGNQFDPNLILLVLSNSAFNRGDATAGIKFADAIKPASLNTATARYEPAHNAFVLNQVRYLIGHLTAIGETDKARPLIPVFGGADEKVYAYLHAADRAYDSARYREGFVMLDSAYSLSTTVNATQITDNMDYRYDLIRTFAMIGGKRMSSLADHLLLNLPEGNKFQATTSIVDGYCRSGAYYKALSYIPSTLTENQEIETKLTILWYAAVRSEVNQDQWRGLDTFLYWDYLSYRNFNLQ